jgi:hypothetical protein
MRQSYDSSLLLSEKQNRSKLKEGMIIEIDEEPHKTLLANAKLRSSSKNNNNSTMMRKTRNSVDTKIPKFEVGGLNLDNNKLPEIRTSHQTSILA